MLFWGCIHNGAIHNVAIDNVAIQNVADDILNFVPFYFVRHFELWGRHYDFHFRHYECTFIMLLIIMTLEIFELFSFNFRQHFELCSHSFFNSHTNL